MTRSREVALAMARKHCQWHVTPVQTGEYKGRQHGNVDYFVLPTLKLVEINAIAANGQAINPEDVTAYSDAPNIVYSKIGQNWYGAVEVSFTHGYAEDDPDLALWHEAISNLEAGQPIEKVQSDLSGFALNLLPFP